MGKANRQGYNGELELAEYLNNLYGTFGFKWIRFGGTEFRKTSRAGDVGLISYDAKKRESYRDPKECNLYWYIWDAKKHQKANPSAWVSKADDDAENWGRRAGIIYAIVGNQKLERYILMSKDTHKDWFPQMEVYKTLRNIVYISLEEFSTLADLQE